MVSLTAEYALRAVAYLAVAQREPRTVHQIAEAMHIPPDYLSKVLQELSKFGLVKSQRGLYGGFTLLRPADELSVLEVVQAVSPIQRLYDCPLSTNGKPRTALCPLHSLLDEAASLVEHLFESRMISDLVDQANNDRVLCVQGNPTTRSDPRLVKPA